LEFAKDHGYINKEVFNKIDSDCERIIGMIVTMANQSEKWIVSPREKR
jgi:hypothetical protein